MKKETILAGITVISIVAAGAFFYAPQDTTLDATTQSFVSDRGGESNIGDGSIRIRPPSNQDIGVEAYTCCDYHDDIKDNHTYTFGSADGTTEQISTTDGDMDDTLWAICRKLPDC